MRVYRICPEEYANDLSGNGAKLFGGRWNSEGLKALYTASSRALALLEILVHANYSTFTERTYSILELNVLDLDYPKVLHKSLSENWNSDIIQEETINIGNRFLVQKESLLLEVPSVIIPDEYNFVLNPVHESFNKVQIISIKKLQLGSRVVKATK